MRAKSGDTGRALIERNFDIVYDYMLQTWGIDLDRMRQVLLRRQSEIANGELDLSVIQIKRIGYEE
jgi:hypothetical protein